MDRGAAFLRVTRLLADLDWCGLRPARATAGRSRPSAAEFADHVDDLIGLLELIRGRTGPMVVVVGHSLGGTIALAAAAPPSRPGRRSGRLRVAPELGRLVAASGPGAAATLEDDPPERRRRALHATGRRRRGLGVAPRRHPGPPARGGPCPGRGADARPAGPRPTLPVEIAVPAHHRPRARTTDDYPERAAAVLARAAPARPSWCCSTGAGHGAHISQPEAFAALVRRALERADGVGEPTL